MKNLISILCLLIQTLCFGQINSIQDFKNVTDSYLKEKIGNCLFFDLLSEPNVTENIDTNSAGEINNSYLVVYTIEKYKTNQKISINLNSDLSMDSTFSLFNKFDKSANENCNLIGWEKLKKICKKRGIKPDQISISCGEYGVIAIYRRGYLFNSSCTIDHYIDLTTGKKVYRGRVCRSF